MSSSDSQPPLTRRQARERERASETGAQPVAPPPGAEPASQSVPASSGAASSGAVSSGAVSSGSGSVTGGAVGPTDSSGEQRRRPGSHAAPVQAPPSQAPVRPASQHVEAAPASATEIVPGTGGLTRRQLRELRAAQSTESVRPVPLQVPTPQSPQSSDRTVADVLGTVAAIEDQKDPDAQRDGTPTIDRALIEQATEADGSPDAIEPLAEAAAHSEEPRRHRSTWAPPPNSPAAEQAEAQQAVADAPDVDPADASHVPAATDDSQVPAATDDQDDESTPVEDTVVPGIPLRAPLPNPTAPGVFPLDLDADDTNEVPVAVSPDVAAADRPSGAGDAAGRRTEPSPGTDADVADRQRASRPDGDATSGARPVEPKPVTSAFAAPAGHWSRQAAEADDHLRDPQTGAVRETQPATNALIMPNSALSDVTGALNATGEVIITGSIDLPKALASTGSHTPIDGAEVDRLLEMHDAEAPSSDASPVRASRAVSSHTSTRAVVLAAAKPKQSRTPTVLAYSAAGFGVVCVAALVIASFALHLF